MLYSFFNDDLTALDVIENDISMEKIHDKYCSGMMHYLSCSTLNTQIYRMAYLNHRVIELIISIIMNYIKNITSDSIVGEDIQSIQTIIHTIKDTDDKLSMILTKSDSKHIIQTMSGFI